MIAFTSSLSAIIETDVIVCGLGPAGLTAAIAAARKGLRVLGVEQYGFAGGNITNASVIGVCGATDMTTGKLIIGGVAQVILRNTALLRDAKDIYKKTPLWEIDIENADLYEPVQESNLNTAVNAVSMLFDAERFKTVADRMLLQSGVSILYHTMICDVKVEDGRISNVVIANKDGLSAVHPKYVIDCTGDGDLAAWSGAPYSIDEKMQAGTTLFTVGGVKFDDFPSFKSDCVRVINEAHIKGEVALYCGPTIGRLWPGIINFNMTRIPYNQTIATEFSAAEIKARKDIDLFMTIFKRELPEAFGQSYMICSGPNIGARESRRIRGLYTLELEDILSRRYFDDGIALGGWTVDYHDPTVSGFNQLKILPPYQIPYRTLVPQKVNNLLVAGRCHSASQAVLASSRVAPTAMVMGEAAGNAIALAVKGKCTPGEINTNELVNILRKDGVKLDHRNI